MACQTFFSPSRETGRRKVCYRCAGRAAPAPCPAAPIPARPPRAGPPRQGGAARPRGATAPARHAPRRKKINFFSNPEQTDYSGGKLNSYTSLTINVSKNTYKFLCTFFTHSVTMVSGSYIKKCSRQGSYGGAKPGARGHPGPRGGPHPRTGRPGPRAP